MWYFTTQFIGGLGSAGLTGVKILEVFSNLKDATISMTFKDSQTEYYVSQSLMFGYLVFLSNVSPSTL